MANRPKGKIVTKKHLARLERERRQNRIILITSIVIIAVVVLLVGYGIVKQYIIEPNQPVARVGDVEITTRQFQTYARYTRLQLINQYAQMQSFMQLFGSDPNNASYFQQSLAQIRTQLQPDLLGQLALDRLIENVFIRQEAERRGITVTKEEIDQAIQAQQGYYPNGTPTPTATLPPQPTSTLSPTQMALLAPTPTAVITATPALTSTEGLTVTATITPTLEEPPIVMPTATASPTVLPSPTAILTPTATPTPYTAELFEQNYKEQLRTLSQVANISEQDYRWIVEMELYRDKVRQAITADVPRNEEQIWARHILVEDLETAQQVIARLQNGENFAVLAAELSTDPGSAAKGGDLGWFGRGKMVAEFENAAFALEIGQISEPVSSSYGYHVIQLLGREERPMADADYQQKQDQAFNDWLSAQRVAADVQIFDYWIERVPTRPELPSSLL